MKRVLPGVSTLFFALAAPPVYAGDAPAPRPEVACLAMEGDCEEAILGAGLAGGAAIWEVATFGAPIGKADNILEAAEIVIEVAFNLGDGPDGDGPPRWALADLRRAGNVLVGVGTFVGLVMSIDALIENCFTEN